MPSFQYEVSPLKEVVTKRKKQMQSWLLVGFRIESQSSCAAIAFSRSRCALDFEFIRNCSVTVAKRQGDTAAAVLSFLLRLPRN
jgi:hypothetical protein